MQDLTLQTAGRLVTLTGPGGCGKTQLALLIAAGSVDSFSDGVWLVDLVPVQTAELLLQTVIAVFGLREQPGETPLETLVAWLGDRRLLLVFDNCEHMIDACAELAEALLDACPNLRLLTTSREPLRISGECVWRVPSLGIPDPHSNLAPDQVARFPAAQLFVQRAQAVKSDFVITSRNAPVVSAICVRLEGLPLAIELAAAWVRALGVEQILERLDDTFGLLVGDSRSLPSRQQTMRATMDWSYGLLTDAERLVFQRLAVFVGGCSLEATENVCSSDKIARKEVLSHITRLVDASLVEVEEHEERARYRLLEPARQYAHMCLGESGELQAVRRQHAAFYLSYAEHWEIDANFGGPGREAALSALELELDNLRAALQWCLEQGEAEKGIFLARALWTLWVSRGLYTEGRSWLSQLAALPAAARAPAVRAVAEGIEATLVWRQGDYAGAKARFERVLMHMPQAQAHAPRLVHSVPTDLGFIAQLEGDQTTARARFEEALAAVRIAGLPIDEAFSLENLGAHAVVEGDYPRARALCQEGLALARAVGDQWAVAGALWWVGWLSFLEGDVSVSHQLLEESVAINRRLGERADLAQTLDFLGVVATAGGQFSRAGEAFTESLLLRQEMEDRSGLAEALEGIAGLAAAKQQPMQAVQLAGAAASIRGSLGSPLTPMRRTVLDQWLVPLHQALGQKVIHSAWETGRAMSLDQALELALAAIHGPPVQTDRQSDESRKRVTQLSPREQEVAALLADGLTNRQIAERLVVTERTVAAHVEHILDKLGFASRHQVATWVAQNGLST